MTKSALAALLFSLALLGHARAEEPKAAFERICSKCHDPSDATSERNTRDRWKNLVEDMVSRGAEGSEAELTMVVDYLAKNYGPKTNVNKATAKELAAGLGLFPTDSEAIVQYREKNGPFKTLPDVTKVPGIDTKRLEEQKDNLAF